jgi:hypothetical protein
VAYAPVTQESVLAYQAGFKLTALDRKLSLTGAAYYYDYKNKQLRTKIIDPIFNLIEALANIPRSDIGVGSWKRLSGRSPACQSVWRARSRTPRSNNTPASTPVVRSPISRAPKCR